MLAVSFSENFVRFGQLVQGETGLSIETIQKKPLEFVFEPALLRDNGFVAKLEPVFTAIQNSLPVPDRYLALSLGTDWFSLSVNAVDADLDPEQVREVLDWNEQQRLGNWYAQKFVQHYPLRSPSNSIQKNYLTVSYYKELGRVLNKASQAAGFTIKVFDINIFSAAQTINLLNPELKNLRWGLWYVDDKRQELLIIENDEFSQYFEFGFTDSENYQVTKFACPDQHGRGIIDQLNGLRTFQTEKIDVLDRVYFFSDNVTTEFFNILLTYEVENFVCFNPFQTIKPVDMDMSDGDGVGAMCQFADVLGLLLRFMPEAKL